MTPSFPLTGLLRLRRLEQDRSAGQLGAAAARLSGLSARADRLAADAEQIPADVDSSEALRAVAAAQAASMGLLAELHALTAIAETERDDAARAFAVARARTVGLEKLEARHASAAAAAELAAEQSVLDELGSTARARAGAEAAGP